MEAHREDECAADEWLNLIRDYAQLEEPNRPTLLRLVKRIEVGEKYQVDGERPIETSKSTTTLSGILNCKSVLLYARLSNDFYAKGTSKKVRSVMKARGTSGKHIGKPPYGCRSDLQDKDYWILDEDAAPAAKRIFDLTIDGAGPSRIAHILEADKVLTAKALYSQRKGKPMPECPYHWIEQSVVGILGRMEYWLRL